ncbi:MAG: NUDIX domain-containing protein [Anaerolineae bacterium]|nr:NUDIX domain-containing protein [Anaerolineae bacterium]
MIEKRKAFAYVTRGKRLLVFEHPHAPEAGIQVPAGTIEPGESPEDAVLREAHEETGLTALRLGAFLGEQRRDMADFGREEIHHRYFYQVICEQETPERWDWGERFPSDEPDVDSTMFRHVFRFYWVDLPDGSPEMIADHGVMLTRLLPML